MLWIMTSWKEMDNMETVYTCTVCGDIHDNIDMMTDPQGDGHLRCLICFDNEMEEINDTGN